MDKPVAAILIGGEDVGADREKPNFVETLKLVGGKVDMLR